MAMTDIHEAGTALPDLVEAALRGEEVLIARDGVPAVKLVPLSRKAGERSGGWARGKVKILDPNWDKPDPELEKLFYEGEVFPENPSGPGSGDGPASR